MALGVVLLELLCCLGLGTAMLRLLGLDGEFRPGEHALFAFAVGFGILGWLLFPLGVSGLLDKGWLWGLLVLGSLGVVLSRRGWSLGLADRPDAICLVLLVLIGIVMAFDLAEAMAPPADADTLAYHFTSPKLFLEAGRIEYILRPPDGSSPYLAQMTYLPALALGGERALTLWTMVSGWAAVALLYVICRRHLGRDWSLAVSLIFLTTPAVIYGAGTGQIEIRLAMFVLVAAWAAARALETGRLSYALLAGLGAGFFVGAKYMGLLFGVACGTTILAQRRWLAHGAVYGTAALIAGFQWYLWNAIHTGDPFFPMLFQWLGREDLVLWTREQDLFFKSTFMYMDRAVPRTPQWAALFPFWATLDPADVIEAKRVGLGPFGLLVLPFAALGVWKFRDRIGRGPLLTYAAVAFLFYALWFFSGPSQRVRHLVPILPLLLVCMTVAAQRFSSERRFRAPLAAALAAILALQMAGATLFSLKYLRHLTSGEDREAFLTRNVSFYPVAVAVNADLSRDDKLLFGERQLFYFVHTPYLFGSAHAQAAVDLSEDQRDPYVLLRQLRSVGITHVVARRSREAGGELRPRSLELLSHTGCATSIRSIVVPIRGSRTLPEPDPRPLVFEILELNGETCVE